jgi:hypothetical protein
VDEFFPEWNAAWQTPEGDEDAPAAEEPEHQEDADDEA